MVAGAGRLLGEGPLRSARPGLVMRWSDARISEHDRGCDPADVGRRRLTLALRLRARRRASGASCATRRRPSWWPS
jgi:hypothetical protein